MASPVTIAGGAPGAAPPPPNTLLATIQKNSAVLAGTQAVGTSDTQAAQQLMAAKSGKSDAAGVGSISSVGEQAANSQTQQTLTNSIAPKIEAQQAQTDVQAAQQTAQYNAQASQVAQSRQFDTANNQIQVQQMMQQLSQDKGNLQTQENQQKLEQTSFLLSMQDKQYTQNLQLVGQTQRLDNSANFQEEQQKLAFGSSLTLLQDKLGVQNAMNISQNDYETALSKMSIDQALQVGQAEMNDAANIAGQNMSLRQYQVGQTAALSGIQAQGQGLQSLIQAGTKGANAYANSQPVAPATPPSTNPVPDSIL